jgi:hypothetical protein
VVARRRFGVNRQRLSSLLRGLDHLEAVAMEKLERKMGEWWKKPLARALIIIALSIILLLVYWLIAADPNSSPV